jgi:hypothetical protein
MDKRINKKIEGYLSDFKDSIREKAASLGITGNDESYQLVQYIYDYERLSLTKDDFMKRKRVKNMVHLADRCCAKRASGEQCTRRKKDADSTFCGTHLKGTPHGVFEVDETPTNQGKKVEVWAQDIQGIIYYIDKVDNVYQAEDIVRGKSNPKIIAKYVKHGENFHIPEFNL